MEKLFIEARRAIIEAHGIDLQTKAFGILNIFNPIVSCAKEECIQYLRNHKKKFKQLDPFDLEFEDMRTCDYCKTYFDMDLHNQSLDRILLNELINLDDEGILQYVMASPQQGMNMYYQLSWNSLAKNGNRRLRYRYCILILAHLGFSEIPLDTAIEMVKMTYPYEAIN